MTGQSNVSHAAWPTFGEFGGEPLRFAQRLLAVERVWGKRRGERRRAGGQRERGHSQATTSGANAARYMRPFSICPDSNPLGGSCGDKSTTVRAWYRPRVLQPVAVGHKTLADYTHICGRELIAEIRELAEPLKGQRVVHISATAFGGGVSEILYTLVPLMRDVGLDCEWQVIYGREEFFNATKLMHNALQGAPQDLDERAVGTPGGATTR